MSGQIIDSVRLYKFNIVNGVRARQQLFIELCAGGRSGWGECVLSYNRTGADLFSIASCFEYIRGKTVSEAIAGVRCMFGVWRHSLTEAAEFALVDLSGKLSGRSAASVLVLEHDRPVPGVASIVTENPDTAAQKARLALEAHRARCIRLRLYGDLEKDRALIGAVRSVCDEKHTFLIGDAAKGYGSPVRFEVEKLGIKLIMLHTAGLDACMDPSEMRLEQWGELNRFVTPLNLVCSYPMQPARLAERLVYPRMAGMVRVQPGRMGSLYDAVQFAEKVRKLGMMLMIGDDHLIGPGCAAWQQIAIGTGADLVEAAEKKRESELYRHALLYNNVEFRGGAYQLRGGNGGFGVELDTRVLARHAAQVLEL